MSATTSNINNDPNTNPLDLENTNKLSKPHLTVTARTDLNQHPCNAAILDSEENASLQQVPGEDYAGTFFVSTEVAAAIKEALKKHHNLDPFGPESAYLGARLHFVGNDRTNRPDYVQIEGRLNVRDADASRLLIQISSQAQGQGNTPIGEAIRKTNQDGWKLCAVSLRETFDTPSPDGKSILITSSYMTEVEPNLVALKAGLFKNISAYEALAILQAHVVEISWINSLGKFSEICRIDQINRNDKGEVQSISTRDANYEERVLMPEHEKVVSIQPLQLATQITKAAMSEITAENISFNIAAGTKIKITHQASKNAPAKTGEGTFIGIHPVDLRKEFKHDEDIDCLVMRLDGENTLKAIPVQMLTSVQTSNYKVDFAHVDFSKREPLSRENAGNELWQLKTDSNSSNLKREYSFTELTPKLIFK